MILRPKTRSIFLLYRIAALATLSALIDPQPASASQQQPQQQQHPHHPPQRSTPIKSKLRSRCNVESEFYCKLEDRCIDIEQHCDFQEQCLGGEDELGCPPERCNFETDHCYWLDAPPSDRSPDFWLRHTVADDGTRRPSAGRQHLHASDRDRAATIRAFGPLLAELSLGLANRSKFLFAPMTWARPVGSGPNESHLWQRRAEIKTPPIGRTSKACQLRFEYAMLSSLVPGGVSSTSISLKLVASPAERRRRRSREPGGANNSIGLEDRQVVWQHQLDGTAATTGSQYWRLGVAELGHLRNFELAFEAASPIWPKSISGGDQENTARADFDQAEPSKGASAGPQASGDSCPPKGPGDAVPGQQAQPSQEHNQPINYVSECLGNGPGHSDGRGLQATPARATDSAKTPAVDSPDTLEGALVALRWLEFRNCHDWPQISGERAKADDNYSYDENVTNSNPDETIAMVPNEHCSRNEFSCSSGSCQPNRLLCNFVDECYSQNGRASFAWPWPPKSPPVGPMSDDESVDLCQVVPGRENFESTDDESDHLASAGDGCRRASRQMQLYSTSKPEKFWHLTGNWPTAGVSIRRPRDKAATHLPARDHTTRSAQGAFLSLEVPPLSNGSLTYWAGITSQWMQKLDENESGQCRLKFFFNSISPLLNAYHGDYSTSRSDPVLKLFIAVEHLALSYEAQKIQQLRQQWPYGRQLKPVKTVDTLLHSALEFDASQLLTYNRSHSTIELMGLDFWREANVEVVNLKPGDSFQLRLVIMAQVLGSAASRIHDPNAPLGSINIDDMATHFGCGSIEDGDLLRSLNKMAIPFWQRAVPRWSDYLKPAARANRTELRGRQVPLLKNKWGRFMTPSSPAPDKDDYYNYEDDLLTRKGGSQIPSGDYDNPTHPHHQHHHNLDQVAPELLVAYVVCTFCLIIGLIALIVFAMVPHVERVMMQHQNHIQLSLSGEISDVPATISNSMTGEFLSELPPGSAARATPFGDALEHLHDETRFSASRDEKLAPDPYP